VQRSGPGLLLAAAALLLGLATLLLGPLAQAAQEGLVVVGALRGRPPGPVVLGRDARLPL
jgi:hypothetical protein